MRLIIRLRIKTLTFHIWIAKSQTLFGINSDLPNGKHIVLWDLDYCTLPEAIETLTEVRTKYGLSTIFITQDNMKKSFRAWCFDEVDFKTYLKILLDTKFVDWFFFQVTVRREKSTLRMTRKANRENQKIVVILGLSPKTKLPEKLNGEIYKTYMDDDFPKIRKELVVE